MMNHPIAAWVLPWVIAVFVAIGAALPVGDALAEQTGTFTGSWVASGKRQPFDFVEGREVGTFNLAGNVSLKDELGEIEDFWAECIGLSDTAAGSSVRCVWRSLKGAKAYSAIITIMLTLATIITLVCRIEAGKVLDAPTFKSGMSACLCVLGVAWLGTTFVAAHIEQINVFAGNLLESKPWLLAVVLFFAAMLLYSQAATTKALMPPALALGVSPAAAIASFAAVSALFVLPTYPTLLAAVEFDDTGSTRIGKYVFDHPFIIPGVLTITLSVILAFLIGPLVI
ncbi:MAG: anaerobic C4-dicarboxylate transporter family protein [Desulfobacterales bacterium]|nr:anaerobic C4-dicarboxylate transporter family protein [Desulfobacterales bacterium]